MFIINQNQNLNDIESLLKEDNEQIESVRFYVGEQEVVHSTEKPASFLNLSLNNNLKLFINDIPTTYEFDEQLNTANYFQETNLQGELAQHEVPFQDAQLIQTFIQNYKSILEKQNPSSQAYTEKQLVDGLQSAISTFSEYNHAHNNPKLVSLIEDLNNEIEDEKANIAKLENEAKSKSTSVIKKLLALQGAQFGFLFYLTYGLYGWDFTEPVSYLLGLSTEAYIFYYFIRHRTNLNMSLLFQKEFDPTRKAAISKEYTDSTAHLRFLQSKLDMAKYRQINSTTKKTSQI